MAKQSNTPVSPETSTNRWQWIAIGALVIAMLLGSIAIYSNVRDVNVETASEREAALEARIAELEAPATEAPTKEPAAPEKPAEGESEDSAQPETQPEAGAQTTIYTMEWFNEKVTQTFTITELLEEVDRPCNENKGLCGAWKKGEDVTIPAGSAFWGDLGTVELSRLPDGVKQVRGEGGWGVYYTKVSYSVSDVYNGGRFLTFGETSASAPAAPQAAVESVIPAPIYRCITSTKVNEMLNAENPGKEFDSYFESTAYAFGQADVNPYTITAGSFFHGTFNQEATSVEDASDLWHGELWQVFVNKEAPNGGRSIPICPAQ